MRTLPKVRRPPLDKHGEPMSGHTMYFPRDLIFKFKTLCTMRGENMREAMRRMIAEDVARAEKKGVVLPRLK